MKGKVLLYKKLLESKENQLKMRLQTRKATENATERQGFTNFKHSPAVKINRWPILKKLITCRS